MALLGYTGHSHCSLSDKEAAALQLGSLSHSIVHLRIYVLVAIVMYIVPYVTTTFLYHKSMNSTTNVNNTG